MNATETAPFDGTFNGPPPAGKLWWSGDHTVPKVGDRVIATFNEWGAGSVIGYVSEHGFLGLRVQPDHLPRWFVAQERRAGRNVSRLHEITLFGVEFKPEA